MPQRTRTILWGLAAVTTLAVCGFWAIHTNTDPIPEPLTDGKIVFDHGPIADAALILANDFTGKINDTNSLLELRDAVQARNRALAALEEQLATQLRSPNPQNSEITRQHYNISKLLMYEGRFEDAAAAIKKSLAAGDSESLTVSVRANLTAGLGICSLRRGEIENCIKCVGPSSCIFPISKEAIHTFPAGSKQAIEYFTESLKLNPNDLRVRWLLNLAYMTLGEYPEKVPRKFLIPLDTFESTVDVGHFQNVAPLIGLTSRGTNQAGGSVFDDFTGDGLPDLFTTSLDDDRGASLFVNRGDGTFEDRSEKAGLGDQVYALNVARADFDNDGNLDVILLRGAWEKAMRMSLLRNIGNGVFEDVTISSGLNEPIASESVAWGDYDNDGLIDLFVSGEYQQAFITKPRQPGEARNRCRLYHNEGHGKFVDVAATAGVADELCSKGSAWGDYDGDGRLDLFVSNINGACRLYHNEGDGKFRDVARELGVTGPDHGFACWFWDYDNDGQLDLYVNDYSSTLADFVAVSLKVPADHHSSRPRLYRNVGAKGFVEVTREVGLDRVLMPMGCNFADIDNDGFLDFYLGTGRMALEILVPNLMFKNEAGQRFHDVTMSSGTGHLQKGHGISFADWDCDGDLDFFVEAGGAVPGDRAYNLLFQNPGHGRHWLKVKLVGRQTNRAAIGAQITAVVQGADGIQRTVHRTVGNNSSFGGNSLVESIGLLDAMSVFELKVYWPTSKTTQTFRDISADQAIEITEGADAFQPLAQPWVGSKAR